MEKEIFIKRLVELRMAKGVSARDMSISIGQSPGYINNIENGVNLPSMTMFFYICNYFNLTPLDFFDIDSSAPTKSNEIIQLLKGLNPEQLDLIIKVIKEIKK